MFSKDNLELVFSSLKENYPDDWLLPLELFELTNDTPLGLKTKNHLENLIKIKPEITHLIKSGIELVEKAPAYL